MKPSGRIFTSCSGGCRMPRMRAYDCSNWVFPRRKRANDFDAFELAGRRVTPTLRAMSGLDFTLFSRGGPVIWVLLALALLGLILFIERALFLHRVQIPAKTFLVGIKNALAKRRLVEALTLCEEAPGPVAVVVKAALLQAEASADEM